MKLISERHVEHVEEYELRFAVLDEPGLSYRFACNALGTPLVKEMAPEAILNLRMCINKEHNVGPAEVKDVSHDYTVPAVKQCDCGGEAYLGRGCGVFICNDCGEHEGLARCFCGWSASGGDGYRELIEMGEQIEEDY